MRRVALVVLLLTSLGAGCAWHPTPQLAPRDAAPRRGLPALQRELASAVQTPAFTNAVWGVEVRSLKSGEILFARNPRTFLMPASNMKVVTLAAAAERLGWDYTFQTRVVAGGPIDHGTLKGDLVILGSGDPSLGGRPGGSPAIVEAWADEIRARGISAIEGRVVGDGGAFAGPGLGAGWAWDYLAYGYAAPAGGLAFNENVAVLVMRAGAAVGDPVTAELRPDATGLAVECRAVTGPKDGDTDLTLDRLPGSRLLRVGGTVALGRTDVTRSVAVDDPALFAASALRKALVLRGIAVAGEAVAGERRPPAVTPPERVLVTYTSPTLAAIGKVTLKVSQNLYADSLLRAMGRPADGGPATVADGIKTVQGVLQGWGIGPDRYVMVDGSGLSRYNYLSADVLVGVLAHLYADPRHRGPFSDALPVAGVDGTLAGRMKNTAAQGNARAKTGSISNARSLSGFVVTADGEPLVFSILVNNFNVPQAEADAVADRVVARLAAFRR
jgi:serine-type D-Ala-D-Ala carboxypeptidase/endopeptidase (penicillin-binding protein 4)